MKSQKITRETLRDIGVRTLSFPDFEIGDTIAVSQRIKEGDKERLQIYQGDVIAKHSNAASSTFTVRKIGANSVSVERIFPLYSDIIESIKVVRKGKVRRSKLYYLRDRIGRAARVGEKVLTREDKERIAASNEKKIEAAAAASKPKPEPVAPEKEVVKEVVETKDTDSE